MSYTDGGRGAGRSGKATHWTRLPGGRNPFRPTENAAAVDARVRGRGGSPRLAVPEWGFGGVCLSLRVGNYCLVPLLQCRLDVKNP